MLKPAQLYKEELEKLFLRTWYDLKYMFYSGWTGSELPTIPDNNYDAHHFASVQVSGKPADNILFDNAFEFALYEKEEGWMLDNYPEWKNPDVIAWQPLPEPYRRFKKELS